jgi:hypothetical protein
VAVGEQTDEQPLDKLFLTDDDVGNFFAQFFNPSRGLDDLFFLRLAHAAGI